MLYISYLYRFIEDLSICHKRSYFCPIKPYDVKINFFKSAALRQFVYRPRYYTDHEERRGFSIPKHQFRGHAMRRQWDQLRKQKKEVKKETSSRLLWLILALLLLATYYLFDFDLSFLFKK